MSRPLSNRFTFGVSSLGFAVAIILLFLLSLDTGETELALFDTLLPALGGDQGSPAVILREIRLPRSLLALLIGASLGLAGAALQGLLRNPLADPGLIGVSGSAAFGAVCVLYFGLAGSFALALPLAGIAGAIVAVIVLLLLAGPQTGTLPLILSGIAINAFAMAATSLALNLAPSPYAALEMVFWMMGSLANRSMEHVWLALPIMVLGWGLILSQTAALSALSLGEDVAQSMGFAITRIRWYIVIGCACAVGAAVAISGVIGFVGLIVPHILRPLVRHDPGRLLWSSVLGGGLLLLAADITVRSLTLQTELKIGVLTALIGGPFFLLLILRQRRMLS